MLCYSSRVKLSCCAELCESLATEHTAKIVCFLELPLGFDCSQSLLKLVSKDKAAVLFGVCQTSPPEVKVSKSHLTLEFGTAEFAVKHRIYNASDRSRLI